jgi:hypothetical protein
MDSFSANYIKPRTSNLTNMSGASITNKRQSQMVFTGYARQVEAINQGLKTQRGAIVFNGSDGPALSNLKNGETFTSPQTLNAIKTTNYCTTINSCNTPYIIPTYYVSCNDIEVQFLTLKKIEPFYISYDPTVTNTGIIQFFFYSSSTNSTPIAIQLLDINSTSLLIIPPDGTGWNNIGYLFRCTPINKLYSNEISGTLDPNYPYSFTNNSGFIKLLILTKEDLSTVATTIANDNTFNPMPNYGYISYIFS